MRTRHDSRRTKGRGRSRFTIIWFIALAVAFPGQGTGQAAAPQPQPSRDAGSAMALHIYAQLTHLIKPREAPALPAPMVSYPVRSPRDATNSSRPLLAPPPQQSKSEIDELVAYYAKLTGRKAEPSPALQPWLPFRPMLPLTKPEMVYAIETTLALNGLAIVPGEAGGIRAGKRE